MSVKRSRGRPLGCKISEETKNKIRVSRYGVTHSQATKDKISTSLKEYFRLKNPLADGMLNDYSEYSSDVTQWIATNRDSINAEDADFITEKQLNNLSRLEICVGSDIEFLFGHNLTPEFLLSLKEEIT